MTQIIVNIYLKNEILDPQGNAILSALYKQGLNEVARVRQGKQLIMTLEDELTPQLLIKIESSVQNFLSNPVIEDFTIEVKNES